jgi:hypothetical protein
VKARLERSLGRLRRRLGGGRASPAEEILAEVATGGARFERLVLTRNRRVMASVGDGGATLRLHCDFRDAPPRVLRAVGLLFSSPPAAAGTRARAEIRAYLAAAGAHRPPPRPRPARPRPPTPEETRHLERLRAEFRAVNASHFGGALPEIPLRLSARMRRRNGHFSSEPLEIAISRSLCLRGAGGEAERTLRHEMIHLWQWANSRRPGHGADFRRWARLLGIPPRATRSVCWMEGAG